MTTKKELRRKAIVECLNATVPAWEAYNKVTAPAREAYEKATAPAQEAYDKAIAPACEERDKRLAEIAKMDIPEG